MEKSVQMTIECLDNVGFILNYPKSQTTPTKVIEFLGFVINTECFEVSLTKEKLLSLRNCMEKALSQRKITIRFLSKIIGKIVSTFPCCDEAPLHYRTLDRFKVKSLRLCKQKWNTMIKLSSQCLQELEWWNVNAGMKMMTKSLHAVDIGEHMYTDSSGHSFGGWWRHRTIQSKFSERQSGLSINTKELLAIFYTLCAFSSSLKGTNVLVHCNNTVAVSCIRKKGSSNPFRDSLTRCIFDTAKQNSFTIQCVWVKGQQNGKADSLSRKMTDFNPRLEWCIPQNNFNTYMNILGLEPDIDLFASHLTFKVDRYCSRMSDPHSFCIDAFTLNWSQFKQPYIFLPFRILSAILKKIQDDNVRNTIVVAPLHPSQAWFPKFMSMC